MYAFHSSDILIFSWCGVPRSKEFDSGWVYRSKFSMFFIHWVSTVCFLHPSIMDKNLCISGLDGFLQSSGTKFSNLDRGISSSSCSRYPSRYFAIFIGIILLNISLRRGSSFSSEGSSWMIIIWSASCGNKMSKHLGFGQGVTKVVGGDYLVLGWWFWWRTSSTRLLKFTLLFQFGHITCREEKFTSWANSNKSTWVQFTVDRWDLAVSTSFGSIYRGEALQAWSILLQSIVDLLGKDTTAEEGPSSILAEVILCNVGGFGFSTTQCYGKLIFSHLMIWCSIFWFWASVRTTTLDFDSLLGAWRIEG